MYSVEEQGSRWTLCGREAPKGRVATSVPEEVIQSQDSRREDVFSDTAERLGITGWGAKRASETQPQMLDQKVRVCKGPWGATVGSRGRG